MKNKLSVNQYMLISIVFLLLIILGVSVGYNAFNSKNNNNSNLSVQSSNNNENDPTNLATPTAPPRTRATGIGDCDHITDTGECNQTIWCDGSCTTGGTSPTAASSQASSAASSATTTTEYVCYDYVYSNYSLTNCTTGIVSVGASASCMCNQTDIHTCYSNYTHPQVKKTFDTSSEGQTCVRCGDKPPACITVRNPGCYRNSSGNYVWTNNPASGYSKVNGINSQSDCIINTPVRCNQNNVNPIENNTNSCSGTQTLNAAQSNSICSSTSQGNMYSINCSENVSATYTPGNLVVKAGQGYDFKVNVTNTNTCTGTFNVSLWNTSYNNTLKLINRESKAGNTSGVNWYNNIKNELVNIVNSYNSRTAGNKVWTETNNTPVGKISYRYVNINGESKTQSKNFEVGNITGNVNYTNNGTNTLSNGMKVENYTSTNTTVVTLIPSKVYLNSSGEEVTSNTPNRLDLGNKFLTDLKTKVSINENENLHNMEIVISELGNNRNIKMTNTGCKIKINDRDINYRIINVENPFDIGTAETGKNWSNTSFNFKETIDKSTWSNNYLYKFDLTSSDIKDIQSSNKNVGTDVYLGLCKQDESIMDEITKKICNIMK